MSPFYVQSVELMSLFKMPEFFLNVNAIWCLLVMSNYISIIQPIRSKVAASPRINLLYFIRLVQVTLLTQIYCIGHPHWNWQNRHNRTITYATTKKMLNTHILTRSSVRQFLLLSIEESSWLTVWLQ